MQPLRFHFIGIASFILFFQLFAVSSVAAQVTLDDCIAQNSFAVLTIVADSDGPGPMVGNSAPTCSPLGGLQPNLFLIISYIELTKIQVAPNYEFIGYSEPGYRGLRYPPITGTFMPTEIIRSYKVLEVVTAMLPPECAVQGGKAAFWPLANYKEDLPANELAHCVTTDEPALDLDGREFNAGSLYVLGGYKIVATIELDDGNEHMQVFYNHEMNRDLAGEGNEKSYTITGYLVLPALTVEAISEDSTGGVTFHYATIGSSNHQTVTVAKQEKLSKQDERITVAFKEITENADKNAEQDGRIDATLNSITANADKNVEQDGRIDATLNSITANADKNAEQDGRIDATLGSITANADKNAEQDGRIDATLNSITANADKNTEQDGRIDATLDSITANTDKNAEQDERIDNLSDPDLNFITRGGDKLYMAGYISRRLYTFNSNTGGDANLVGNITVPYFGGHEFLILGLAWHEETSKLYMVGYYYSIGGSRSGSNRSGLFELNPDTWVATQVGNANFFNAGIGHPVGLVSHEGVLYILESGKIHRVNVQTGVATQVVPNAPNHFGFVNEKHPKGLTSHKGKLYMVGGWTDALYTLNPETGAATRVDEDESIHQFGVGEQHTRGLASHNGVLYMVGALNDALYILDTETGAATRVDEDESIYRFGVDENFPGRLVSIPNGEEEVRKSAVFKSVTRAEYDALPDTSAESDDATIYLIRNSNGDCCEIGYRGQ